MFLHSVAIQDQLLTPDGIFTFDLAVNPLSMVLLAIRPLNDTGTLTNFQTYRGLCAAMNRISIQYRGESIFSMRGEDVAALNYYRWGMMPYQGQHDQTNDERRCAVLPLMLGRWPYSKKSCFPASRRGELVLELDVDIADTGYDGLRISAESVEILDAKPTEFEKKVQVTQTWVATGDQDFDLPPGNLNRGLLLFGTTPFAGAAPAPSWGRIKVLLDNQEAGYAATDFEVAQMLHCLWGRQPPAYDTHIHNFEPVAGTVTIGSPFNIGSGYENYCFLDFDPTADDAHSLDTRNKSRFHLRSNVETADAVRVVPLEVIKL